MCIHPRCKNDTTYILMNTKWGKSVQLCDEHARLYQRVGGGKLINKEAEAERFRRGLKLHQEE